MESNFCIFIISHGRPEDVITLGTLKKAGSTLPTYIVIDSHDKTADDYLKKYREKVFIFDKDKYAAMVDQYDNFNNLRTTTHARNACFDLAKELGYQYFLVLDDDYISFRFRINSKLGFPASSPNIDKNLDEIFLATLEYYKNSNFLSICYSQGGDWFGGESHFNKKPKRKAMNSFFCSVERRFWFVSRLNEDVNTYMALGRQGHVFMTIPFIQLNQKATQETKGGMSESYQECSTYVKTFYTLMNRPDCAKINLMGLANKRLHHLIDWSVAVPVIIDEKHKKMPQSNKANNIVKVLDSEFLITDNMGTIKFCEINSKYGTKIKLIYDYKNECIENLTESLIEEATERIHIREIENNNQQN